MTRRDIRLAAESFLKEHHADLSIPVPIEDILELKLGVEIRPLPGLRQAHSRSGILLSSGKVIAVDNHDFESNQTRLRFTLAHELGHILLHEVHVKSVSIDDAAQAWKQYSSIDSKVLGEMESDASYFAGHILVPRVALVAELDRVKQKLPADPKHDITGKGVAVRDTVARTMASPFGVSPKVVRIRLEEEGLP